MEQPLLRLNLNSLEKVLKDFYVLTNIKISIFDTNYNEIVSYPKDHCAFCKLMNQNEFTRNKCAASNERSFRHCNMHRDLYINHCHANLIEATYPLIQNDVVIGYLMFGQITDEQNKKVIKSNIIEYLEKNDIKIPAEPEYFSITRKSKEQISAASKILEACTFYILLKDYVKLQESNFIVKLNRYIDEHISEDLSIETLMSVFNISKNKLYNKFNEFLNCGIAEHIKSRRIEKAKDLLKNTNKKIHTISNDVGFNDYNYFCRVFKKEVGMSAKQYRKS